MTSRLGAGGGSVVVSRTSQPAAAEQGPDDEQGLEEQPDQPLAVGVEAERVDAFYILRDVAGEDRHEERGKQRSDETSLARQQDERQPEPDLDDARADHRQVLINREPVGHLRSELL